MSGKKDKSKDDGRLAEGIPKEGIVPLLEVVKRIDPIDDEKPEEVRRAEKAGLYW